MAGRAFLAEECVGSRDLAGRVRRVIARDCRDSQPGERYGETEKREIPLPEEQSGEFLQVPAVDSLRKTFGGSLDHDLVTDGDKGVDSAQHEQRDRQGHMYQQPAVQNDVHFALPG